MDVRPRPVNQSSCRIALYFLYEIRFECKLLQQTRRPRCAENSGLGGAWRIELEAWRPMGSSLNAIIESAPPKKNGSARRPHRRVGCEALAPSFRQLKESEKERERERERERGSIGNEGPTFLHCVNGKKSR